MNELNVYLLTEGFGEIGYGHITRCISLYQAFEAFGIKAEFIINIKANAEYSPILLKEVNYQVLDWISNEDVLLNKITERDVVIIDSYHAGKDLYEKISKSAKLAVYFDDFQRIDYPAGIIINSAIGAEELNYNIREGILYLLGIKYHPVRREFCDCRQKVIRENAESIMVTLGGSDIRDMTTTIIELLQTEFPDLTKNVVIAGGFSDIDRFQSYCDDKVVFFYSPDIDEMRNIMLNSDIAISAGGQTLFELACVGVPTICMMVAENQKNNIQGWLRSGFIEYAGSWDDENLLEALLGKLNNLMDYKARNDKFIISRRLNISEGSGNIVNNILKWLSVKA